MKGSGNGLKMYTLIGPKLVFEKNKFKFLHYDFICQRPGHSKGQISMFKSLVIN